MMVIMNKIYTRRAEITFENEEVSGERSINNTESALIGRYMGVKRTNYINNMEYTEQELHSMERDCWFNNMFTFTGSIDDNTCWEVKLVSNITKVRKEFPTTPAEGHNNGGDICIVHCTNTETHESYYVVRQYVIYVSDINGCNNLVFVHQRSWSLEEILEKEKETKFLSRYWFDLDKFRGESDI